MFRQIWIPLLLPALLGAIPTSAAGNQEQTVVLAQNRGRGQEGTRAVPRAVPRPRPGREGAWRPLDRRTTYQEPAFARGFADGYDRGVEDNRDRDRYDPVGHRDYRSADQGYSRDYGSRDAYRNNYRAGFRQGYDEGYRGGDRDRKR